MKDGELTLDKFNIPLDNYLLGAFSQSKKSVDFLPFRSASNYPPFKRGICRHAMSYLFVNKLKNVTQTL